jgi:SAM-dependent methyltransferase
MSAATSTHDDSSAVWAGHYATPAGLRWWPCEELVRALARRPAPGARVLEVGCGNGANLWCLAEHFAAVTGLEASGAALRVARGYVARRAPGAPVALVLGDARRLPFAEATFDAVVDVMTSQHLPWADHDAAYAGYARVLRPGGWLFLYHLTRGTSGSGRAPDVARLALFPAAGLTCLPSVTALETAVLRAGLGLREGRSRELARRYPDGMTAHYAVLEGERHA